MARGGGGGGGGRGRGSRHKISPEVKVGCVGESTQAKLKLPCRPAADSSMPTAAACSWEAASNKPKMQTLDEGGQVSTSWVVVVA